MSLALMTGSAESNRPNTGQTKVDLGHHLKNLANEPY
jgi:hypothetical protein